MSEPFIDDVCHSTEFHNIPLVTSHVTEANSTEVNAIDNSGIPDVELDILSLPEATTDAFTSMSDSAFEKKPFVINDDAFPVQHNIPQQEQVQ